MFCPMVTAINLQWPPPTINEARTSGPPHPEFIPLYAICTTVSSSRYGVGVYQNVSMSRDPSKPGDWGSPFFNPCSLPGAPRLDRGGKPARTSTPRVFFFSGVFCRRFPPGAETWHCCRSPQYLHT